MSNRDTGVLQLYELRLVLSKVYELYGNFHCGGVQITVAKRFLNNDLSTRLAAATVSHDLVTSKKPQNVGILEIVIID